MYYLFGPAKGWIPFRSSSPLKIKNPRDSSAPCSVQGCKQGISYLRRTNCIHMEKMCPTILLASKITNSVSPHQSTDHSMWFSFFWLWLVREKEKSKRKKSRLPKGKYYWGKIIYASLTENRIWMYLFLPLLSFFSNKPPTSEHHLSSPFSCKVFLKSHLHSQLCYVSFPRKFCVWILLVYYTCLKEVALVSAQRPCLLTWCKEAEKFIIP